MSDNQKFWEVWGQTNALYSEYTASKKINYYVLFVLYTLDNHNCMTQKKICEYTGMTKQTVNSVIRELKNKEYITLSSGLEDKREKEVILTERGSKYAKEVLTPLYELESNVFNLIGKERVNKMIEILTLFNTVFENKLKLDK